MPSLNQVRNDRGEVTRLPASPLCRLQNIFLQRRALILATGGYHAPEERERIAAAAVEGWPWLRIVLKSGPLTEINWPTASELNEAAASPKYSVDASVDISICCAIGRDPL
jgi:hypothetical protein